MGYQDDRKNESRERKQGKKLVREIKQKVERERIIRK